MTKTALENLKIEKDKQIAHERIIHEKKENERQRKFTASENAKQREHEKRRGRAANWTKIGTQAMSDASRVASAAISRNDPEWYRRYIPNLYEFTNIPTYERLGSSRYQNTYCEGMTRPGIMGIVLLDTIGSQDSNNVSQSPVNQILMRSKEMVLKLNSRSNVNWEAGDLGFNIFASASIISLFAIAKRALEAYKTYKGDNSYFARDLLTVMRISSSDLIDHYADYRKRYAILAERFNKSIVAPRALSLFDRKWFLYSSVFADHSSTELTRQVYLYVPHKVFTLNSTGDAILADGWAELGATTGHTLSSLFNRIETQIQRITENPDYIEMYADLRAAFGQDLFQINPELEDSLYINTDELNRIQIHNLKTLPAIFNESHDYRAFYMDDGNCTLSQDTAGWLWQGYGGFVGYSFKWYGSGSNAGFVSGGSLTTLGGTVRDILKGHYFNFLCDSPNVAVSGDEILDGTRGMVKVHGVDTDSSNNFRVVVYECGTEIALGWQMFYYGAGSSVLSYTPGTTFTCTVNANTNELEGVLRQFGLLSDFDWMPECAFRSVNAQYYTHYDMYHAYVISADTLASLHEACVLSEFYLSATSFSGSGM